MRARWRLIACAGYAPLGLVRTMHRLKADGFKVAAIRPLQGDGLPTKYPIANGKSVKGFFLFYDALLEVENHDRGTWCSGITSSSHAEGPGFNPQCVHLMSERSRMFK